MKELLTAAARGLGPCLLIGALVVGSAHGQTPPKKKSGLIKAAAKLVDTTATAAAAGAVDSLLGTKAGPATCPAGTVPTTAAPAGPTVGSEVVAAAKKQLVGANDSSGAQAPAAAAQPACVQAPPTASAAVAPTTPATPVGNAVAAVAAAPVALKTVGGLLGGKGPTKEGMIKELAKGRLVLKGVKFIVASDALVEPIDDDMAALAEALTAMEGRYLLNMPAEARDKEAPDTAIARRRLTKLVAHLQVAGVPADRVVAAGIYPPGLDPKAKPPKPGDARPEVLPIPKDFAGEKH